MTWIKNLILANCPQHEIFFDVFGGTGVVTAEMLDFVSSAIINDFLYSNEVCYKAFFSRAEYNQQKLQQFADKITAIDKFSLSDNYVSLNYGDKYFDYNDAKLIGYIRAEIQNAYTFGALNEKEFNILLASLFR